MKIDRQILIAFCSSLIPVGLNIWMFIVEKSIGYIIALVLTICMSGVLLACLFWDFRVKKEQNADVDADKKERFSDLSKNERRCSNIMWVASLISMLITTAALIFYFFI